MAKKYWLLKSEADCYSLDDLKRDKRTFWDGIRNYQARNLLRDELKVGDLAFFYHSSQKPPGIAGVCKVVKAGYPDHTQFDPKADHFDPKASTDNPTWMMVDVEFIKKFEEEIPLDELKSTGGLDEMVVTRRGSRLSVQPVTLAEWKIVNKLRK